MSVKYHLGWFDYRTKKEASAEFDTLYDAWKMQKWLTEKHYGTHFCHYSTEDKHFWFGYPDSQVEQMKAERAERINQKETQSQSSEDQEEE